MSHDGWAVGGVSTLFDVQFGEINNLLAGIVIGLIIPAGWYVTGVIGFDDFEPVRLESYTFIAPTAESLQYLMTFTGSTISFGVAAVFGVMLGSFLYVILTGKFLLETFSDRSDMVRHLLGAVAMGFGGVLALGCTIGQGVTGMSTLALGSLLLAPRARSEGAFFRGLSPNGQPPGLLTLTLSQVTTWIFPYLFLTSRVVSRVAGKLLLTLR